MDPSRLFMRMASLARNPPSMQRVLLAAGVVALVLLIAGGDKLGLFPDWMSADRVRVPKISAPDPAPVTP